MLYFQVLFYVGQRHKYVHKKCTLLQNYKPSITETYSLTT